VSSGVVALVLAVFYAGIVTNEGWDALAGNRFVTPLPVGDLLLGLPAGMLGILAHWARGVPLPVAVAIGALVLAGLRLGSRREPWRWLCVALLAGVAIALAVARNLGEPRIWLWGMPVLCVAAGVGAAELGARFFASRGAVAAAAATAVCALVIAANVVIAQPVRASRETGVLPELLEIYQAVRDEYRLGDAVLGDFVGAEPLRYYLERWAASRSVPARSAVERAWVLVDPRDSVRTARARNQLAGLGAPPLEESEPVARIGVVSVYLLARPTGAPDPRIAEAIDWHTGVRGSVDDGRAHALLSAVLSETGSPLARVWLARCGVVGCMGLPGGRELDAQDRDALAEVGELALAGFAESAYLLGASLDEGWSGTVDLATAARWYRQAAEAGHVLAARALADAYSAGRGVPRDDALAAAWWDAAAEAGDPVSRARVRAAR
jgi:hypothetical protein